MKNNYLFTSKRLGFRSWEISDLEEMSAINADSEVMEYFPKTLSKQETQAFIERQF
jgi:RimJ/RimL family protein N-acetyltransferase